MAVSEYEPGHDSHDTLVSLEADNVATQGKGRSLTSSYLRWISILSYIVQTVTVFDRDESQPGSQSVVGAVAENTTLYYCLTVSIIISSLAYAFACAKQLNESRGCVVKQHNDGNVLSQDRGFVDWINRHPKMCLLYWGSGLTSCLFALVNMSILINTRVNEKAQNSSGVITDNPLNINNTLINNTNITMHAQSSSNTDNTDYRPPQEFIILNSIAVVISVWAWNLCSVIEASVYAKKQFPDEKDRARQSYCYLICNVFRTLATCGIGEHVTYPAYVIMHWLSLPVPCKKSAVRIQPI